MEGKEWFEIHSSFQSRLFRVLPQPPTNPSTLHLPQCHCCREDWRWSSVLLCPSRDTLGPGSPPTPVSDRGVNGQEDHGWEQGEGGKRRCWACTHTSICRVDGLKGLGTLSIHKCAPNEELVGHSEGQLVHFLFHLERKVSQALAVMWILHKWASLDGTNPPGDTGNTDG